MIEEYDLDKILRKDAFEKGTEEKTPSKSTEPVKEHILTCLSSSLSNAIVIRTAAHISKAFRAELTALYMEEPESPERSGEERSILHANMALARDLGAQIVTVSGKNLPGQIAGYAQRNGVTKIIVGGSSRKRNGILSDAALAERLIKLAPGIDIYAIPDKHPSFKGENPELRFSPLDMIKAVAILAVASFVGMWFCQLGFSDANVITVYLLGVLVTAISTKGHRYSAAVSVLSVLIFNYLFTEPRFTLLAYGTGYPITFLIMLSASFIVSTLTMRVKSQARESAKKAYRTQVLLETNQKLQQAEEDTEIFETTALQMQKIVGRTVLFYPVKCEKGKQTLAVPLVFSAPDDLDTARFTTPEEQKAAQWVLKNETCAGATTVTLPNAECFYQAVRGHNRVLAVSAVAVKRQESLDTFAKNLVIAILGECGLTLEKATLDREKTEAESRARQEQLRVNLLRAVSHDLRTPLTAISGNAEILLKSSGESDEKMMKKLYLDIYDDSMWLIHLVENLLSITRIENGAMGIHKEAELLDEVFHEALSHISRKQSEHLISVSLSDELLMAKMDVRLIIQVIINLVDNAIQYTPNGSHITISAQRQGEWAVVRIADDGPGIAQESKTKLFHMFYTTGNGREDGHKGLGLGLSLCKSIIAAHGGEISVSDNTPCGTVFCFTLQAAEAGSLEQPDL